MLASLRRLALARPAGARMMSGHSMEHAIGARQRLPSPPPPPSLRLAALHSLEAAQRNIHLDKPPRAPMRTVRHAPPLTPVRPPVPPPRLLAAETSKWKKISYAFIPFCCVYSVAVYVMHGAHHHEHEEVRG